jgi:hypothetical protein
MPYLLSAEVHIGDIIVDHGVPVGAGPLFVFTGMPAPSRQQTLNPNLWLDSWVMIHPVANDNNTALNKTLQFDFSVRDGDTKTRNASLCARMQNNRALPRGGTQD